MSYFKADFIVVGSGIAGLSVALLLAKRGHVIIITKATVDASNTYRAQGGIAAAIGEADSPSLHQMDTIRTGVDLCHPQSVELLVKQAPHAIQQLVEWGTPFDQQDGEWMLGKEGSHSANRILHIAGDATGKGIADALIKQLLQKSQVEFHTHTKVEDLLVEMGVCMGLVATDKKGDRQIYTATQGVVMASGGCGQLYQYTTNDQGAIGDGFAIAHRAGAQLMDMEFIQFHPTAFHIDQNPMFLISEAVRGEGAVLINQHGERIMEHIHPWLDLAPRDVVTRAIYDQQQKGNRVLLDTTPLKDMIERRFPTIYTKVRKHGYDPRFEPIPVTPVAHFIMGGIRTNLSGETSIARLFACGEVACTGVHGANRLASNSLLEGIVFAGQIAKQITQLPPLSVDINQFMLSDSLVDDQEEIDQWRTQLQQLMWQYAGIIRTETGLQNGRQALEDLKPIGKETKNMWITAQIIIESALCRTESRGGHYRSDYPELQATWAKKHIVIGV
ncbi:L-aspartate oxidase [Seinonella peptonophila]|uniref:L-aspartate oxidase n=1 Tax=Seinonella peptonophila TaxID=112248 RepID=A0A1M5A7R7_9BACL|nr:L-aspartate oxidase [Seinonella peptonophila]SHF26197.1 L-aspartate oxidase [Seinonella peptonophila]